MHDNIAAIAARYAEAKDYITTEEATKTALIMPFLSALGYDVHNPLEVCPEYTADVGIKKGEKVDFAIKRGQSVIMLMECKWCGYDLNGTNTSQLFRYFSTSEAHIAILTNGLQYQFYADLETPNIMDSVPFFVFNIFDFDRFGLDGLNAFAKNNFDDSAILTMADEIKTQSDIKCKLEEYCREPSEAFVRCLLADIGYQGRVTRNVVNMSSENIKVALNLFIKKKCREMFGAAMRQADGIENLGVDNEDGIITTKDEIEGYAIIKSIAREVVPASRVTILDSVSYCSVLLDADQQKPIARMYFNDPNNKAIAFLDSPTSGLDKRLPIGGLDEIFQHANRIKAAVRGHVEGWTETQGHNALTNETLRPDIVATEPERIKTQCPQCQVIYRVRPEYVGRSLTCKKCGAQFAITAMGAIGA